MFYIFDLQHYNEPARYVGKNARYAHELYESMLASDATPCCIVARPPADPNDRPKQHLLDAGMLHRFADEQYTGPGADLPWYLVEVI